MPNTRAARKYVRQTATRTVRNKMYKSRMKTLIRRYQEVLRQGDQAQAETILRRAISAIDKAAKKNVIHKNTAARKKAQLTGKLNRSA